MNIDSTRQIAILFDQPASSRDHGRIAGKPEVGRSRTTKAIFGLKLARLGRERFQLAAELIPYSAKGCHALLIRSHRRRRVLEALMQPFHRARGSRAALFDVIANSADVIKTLPYEFIDVFRAMYC